MPMRALDELPPRAGVSPGLLRRRYSMPETIMRKYHLAQQNTESERSGPATAASTVSVVTSTAPALSSCGSLCDAGRSARRDRELMRKSALLRRLWGRAGAPEIACCCCGADESRSLDTSRCELRPLSAPCPSLSASPRASPKRQRLNSPRDFRICDDMLRTAMRNSSDRSEESNTDKNSDPIVAASQSHHEYKSYNCVETVIDTYADSDVTKLFSDRISTDTVTAELVSDQTNTPMESYSSGMRAHSSGQSFTDTVPSFTIADKETRSCAALLDCELISASEHIDGQFSERSGSINNGDKNLLPYTSPLSIESPSYEVLEIIVSETLPENSTPTIKNNSLEKNHHINPVIKEKNMHDINIDDYVSNILVESLNSLTDQLESMNASIANDRKINIVEKEIKVKLQNTGVNTIVHLSPTSNNQIIFGNEELCNNDKRKDSCNNVKDSATIREETHSTESNNNVTSASSPRCYSATEFNNLIHHDNVNQAVLQQIQKLFQDELQNLNSDNDYSGNAIPGISHIEISNLDVYIDNCGEETAVDDITRDAISGVNTGNYFEDTRDTSVVPRFSAFPHTESMEVNTSSSDDVEMIGSDCTSLVDSLDDPNSPRSMLLRRSYSNRRGELVRSAIDVLDLLPESSGQNENDQPRDKGEAFFIRIKDEECDCEKENTNVAEHMPEKIRQRLYLRQKKRELRMECARRSKVKTMKKELEKQRYKDECRAKKVLEKECMAIINSLIDDVIAKIAHDEYKYMRIKQKSNRMIPSKSEENISRRNRKKDSEVLSDRTKKNKSNKPSSKLYKSERHQLHGKLSLLSRPQLILDDRSSKRIYQKSEIHEGNKCVEILEILEYVNGSQSSPETTNSEENLSSGTKNKKSRIPIPVYERVHRCSTSNQSSGSNGQTSPTHDRPTPSRLLDVLNPQPAAPPVPPTRRSSVSHAEPRSRSNSLRFKGVFDMIPEERSSLSVESSNEDQNQNRRASAPDAINDHRKEVSSENEIFQPSDVKITKRQTLNDGTRRVRDMRNTATSPLSNYEMKKPVLRQSQTTMTSPGSKSAATSPLPSGGAWSPGMAQAVCCGPHPPPLLMPHRTPPLCP